ncbi:cytochrome P450 [Halalkalicoccus jeotgali]|uniref:Cytochrome P450 n=1 Tax=Halalkalicoccus jeotgali (strain DSM 18796 / CECT 7217 / JCM 14584 / KCTC 4019 / B3) TaxID=795797 RepID=D8J4E9_HALJB|nr:cytochrome P450 [Halalkalicoccus jeotgali]ADJ13511.1 cytochrome P450 [Halalkalicoccus jeotgali B3]ELY33014.1 cytochrome P450 [Halalkalicoccus jeotgali B3]
MSSAEPQGLQAFPEELSTREAWLEPYGWYREMRENEPVRYDPGRNSWDVFRYADVKRILNDDATFSVDPEKATDFVEPEGEGEGLILDTMLFEDPPRHDDLRGVVEDSFRPRAIRELEPRIRELTREILDDALEGEGEMDLVSEFAYPLPVVVIAELLGVPVEDRDRFKEWSDAIVSSASDDEGGAEFAERQQEVQREMGFYFLQLIEERRENPRDDLISTIATAEIDGEPLPREEVLGTCILLLVAGNITTTNLITNAVRCFGENDLFGTYTDAGAVPTPAIEETLRYRAPVQAMTRIATEDVTVGGETIGAGDRVIAWMGSANRDDRQFPEGDSFVPDRSPNQHLGFGHGTHYCLGAPLARLEAEVALSELFDRLAGVEFADARLQPTRSSFIYGVESLPLRYSV